MLQRLLADEQGQALVEYGLILGIVSVALIAVLTTMKANLLNIFIELTSQLKKATAK